MNKEIIYADAFQDCFVQEKNPYAPPERYFIVAKNSEDYYIDTFQLEGDFCIDFCWTEEQVKKIGWSFLVRKHFEYHNLGTAWQTARLIKRYYPPKIYDDLLKEVLEDAKN